MQEMVMWGVRFNFMSEISFIVSLFRYVKEAFQNIVQDLDWMDEKTKERAFEKLDKMKPHIG